LKPTSAAILDYPFCLNPKVSSAGKISLDKFDKYDIFGNKEKNVKNDINGNFLFMKKRWRRE
jgi:hypothetical protein